MDWIDNNTCISVFACTVGVCCQSVYVIIEDGVIRVCVY